MEIITQLDDDAARKLSYIQGKTGQDTEAVLKSRLMTIIKSYNIPRKPR